MYLTIIEEKKNTDRFSDRIALAANIAKAQRRFGDMSNEQNVHRMICHLFGEDNGIKREDGSVLYRKITPSGNRMYIQSDSPVNIKKVDNLGYKVVQRIDLDDLLQANVKDGSCLLLNAKYAPTKSVNGKKMGIQNVEDRIAWVKRKAEASGFEIVAISEMSEDHICFNHEKNRNDRKKSCFVNAYVYHMAARVKDSSKFRESVRKGIGRGKAYGCGMTLFKPAYIQG